MRSRHSIAYVQQVWGIWRKKDFRPNFEKTSRGIPCRFFSPRISDSLQNYTEGSPVSVEDIHWVIAFLSKCLISLFHNFLARQILIFWKSWKDRRLIFRKMRSRHSIAYVQQVWGLWRKQDFRPNLEKTSRGTPCRFCFTSKTVISDSLQNYTEGSPVSVEDIHWVIAFLSKFLI